MKQNISNKSKAQLFNELKTMRQRVTELEALVGAGRGVAARKQIEKALRESEEKYRSLTNQLPIGVYRTTKAGKILHANPVLATICFRPMDEEAYWQIQFMSVLWKKSAL